MNIRKAKKDDFEAIQSLNQQIFLFEIEQCQPAGWNKEFPYQKSGMDYIKKAIDNAEGYQGFIAEKESKIVAYMILKIIPDEDLSHRNNIKLVELDTFCVDDAFRNQGIGQKMVSEAKIWAKEQGANHLEVGFMAGNNAARDFYNKVGFKEFEVTYEMEL